MELKRDPRGLLGEVFKSPLVNGLIFYFTMNPNTVRGNHYHTRKTESFVCIQGKALLSIRNRETNDTVIYEMNGEHPEIFTVTPNHTHNVISKTGCIMLVYCSKEFSDDDPDTIAEVV